MLVTRILFIFLLTITFLACSSGTVSVKEYSNINLSAFRTYAWYGLAQIEPDEFRSGGDGVVDIVEQQVRKLLLESDITETTISNAQILVTLRVRFQNALNVENQYRKRAGSNIFSPDSKAIIDSDSNVLLSDVDAPLYGDQQRGSISLIIYDAKSKKPLKEGSATVVLPQDLGNQKQLLHLERAVQQLVERLFG